MMNGKKKSIFPYDFYSEHKGWRFAVRAMNKNELIDAMFWLSFLTLYRERINLLFLCSDKFHYDMQYTESGSAEICMRQGARMHVKMVGPIVDVQTLNDAVKNK